jgi:hypothetical protein
MVQMLRIVLILACICGTSAAQNGPGQSGAVQQPAIEQAILDVHAEMKKAAENLDVESLYGCVLDGVNDPIVEDGRVAQTRQEALETTRRGLQRLSRLSYDYTRQHITVLSPTTALWVAYGSVSATLLDGREISAPFAETIIFSARDGKWKVLHAHRSSPNGP